MNHEIDVERYNNMCAFVNKVTSLFRTKSGYSNDTTYTSTTRVINGEAILSALKKLGNGQDRPEKKNRIRGIEYPLA